jgi:hypothetical protein
MSSTANLNVVPEELLTWQNEEKMIEIFERIANDIHSVHWMTRVAAGSRNKMHSIVCAMLGIRSTTSVDYVEIKKMRLRPVDGDFSHTEVIVDAVPVDSRTGKELSEGLKDDVLANVLEIAANVLAVSIYWHLNEEETAAFKQHTVAWLGCTPEQFEKACQEAEDIVDREGVNIDELRQGVIAWKKERGQENNE